MINLTQHLATQQQIDAGVVDLPDDDRVVLTSLLTFDDLPSKAELIQRALEIGELAEEACTNAGYNTAMIGGAPYLMSFLEEALKARGIEPYYAFSKRVSVDKTTDKGERVKHSVFLHEGFIPA